MALKENVISTTSGKKTHLKLMLFITVSNAILALSKLYRVLN